MNKEAYPELLESLGFIGTFPPNDGNRLRHRDRDVPTLYFNSNRDRLIYIAVFARERDMFPDDLWEDFPGYVKVKDRGPTYRAIVPRQGKEHLALSDLINRSPALVPQV
jgi:hypothetical protein